MSQMKEFIVAAGLLFAALSAPARADDEMAQRQARWKEVAAAVFGERVIEDGSALLKLTTPAQAMDASLVPVTIELTEDAPIVAVSLVIDNNPSPLAGTFRFGPAFSRQPIKMRVRINEFTLVHAVAETSDGRLHSIARYVKAAGGCSAPSATQSTEVLARLGKMQLRRERTADAAIVPAQLLISHPNFSGMQQNPATGEYTPARYLERVSVSVGGSKVFDLEAGFSLSEDPAVSFTYKGQGEVAVTASDSSSAQFAQRFEPLQ